MCPPVRMWKHIADHLESLALWSLRWWDDDSGASAAAKGGGHVGSQSLEQAISDRSPTPKGLMRLEEGIEDALVPSQFLGMVTHQATFLPAGMIDVLVTADTILGEIPDLLDSENGKEVASYILLSARQVFAITAVHCGFRSERLKRAMALF